MSNLATIVNNILADSGIDDINVIVSTGSYSNPAWITALSWTKITDKPTTLAGYGITDAYTQTQVNNLLAGYVTLDTTQTITGQKTFSLGTRFENEIYLKQDAFVTSVAGYTAIGSDADNIFLSITSNKYAILYLGDLTTQRTYNLPNADGTIALVGGAGVGTVTSVAALTLGTSGTDLSSTVANSTTTPVITLNVPTASATNRGALSAADWTTFNNKQNALTNPVTGTGTTNFLPKFTGNSTIGNSATQTDATGNLMVGSANAGNAGTINVSVGVAGTTAGGIQLWAATNQTHYIQFGDGTTGAQVYAGYLGYAHSTDSLLFGTNGADKMTLNSSGNLGLGVTPSAWTDYKVLQFGGGSISSYVDNNFFEVNQNAFWNGSSYRYVNNGFASRYQQTASRHEWYNAPSGTAGNAISFTQAMTLTSGGNLLVGTTTDNGARLQVSGAATVSGSVGVNGVTSPAAELQVGKSSDVVIAMSNSSSVTSGARGSLAFYNSSVSTVALIRAAAVTDNVGTELQFHTRPASGSLTQAMTLTSSGNLGLGVTPSAWNSSFRAIQVGVGASFWASNISTLPYAYMSSNQLYDASNTSRYIINGSASWYIQEEGTHKWLTAPSGTAGNAISFTQAMTLNASGNLMLGTTTATTGFSRISLVGGESNGAGPNTGIQLTYNAGAFGGGAITTINAAGGGISFYNFTGNVGSESYSQVMTLFNTGNLLVQTGGTRTDNGARLQVSGAAAIGSGTQGINTDADLTLREGVAFVGLDFKSARTSGNVGGLRFYNTSSDSVPIAQQLIETDGKFVFYNGTLGAESRLTITSSGNVGIGTAPASKLDVLGEIRSTSTSGYAALLSISALGYSILADTHIGGAMTIWTAGSERMRITSSGNVGIGTTTDAGYKLDINGAGRFLSGSSSTIGLIVGGAGGAGSTRQGQLRFGDAGSVYKIQGGEDYSAFNFMIGTGTPLTIASNAAATFSSSVTAGGTFTSSMGNNALIFNSSSATTGFQYITLINSGASMTLGIERSTGGALSNGSTAYASLLQTSNSTDLQFGTANNVRMTINSGGNVGIGTPGPNSRLQVSGSLALPHTTKSANYTLDATDYTVGFDCASNRTAFLPDATTCAGRVYVIYQYNTGTGGSRYVTLDGNGSQTINGLTTVSLQYNEDYSSLMIQSNGSNWIVIADALYPSPL